MISARKAINFNYFISTILSCNIIASVNLLPDTINANSIKFQRFTTVATLSPAADQSESKNSPSSKDAVLLVRGTIKIS